MVSRSGSRRVDPGSPLVDLDLVFADDARVDELTRGMPDTGHPTVPEGRVAGHRAADASPGWGRAVGGPAQHMRVVDRDPLMDLLRNWRAELTAPPLPPAPDVHRVMSAGAGGAAERPLRSVLAVAAAIVALLVGSATVGSRHAAPDSALWAVTRVIWPDRAESLASSQNVQQALHRAQVALATGRTQDAQLALLLAATELGKVDDGDGRIDMQAQVDQLWRVAAPQGLSGTSLAPDLLAGEPAGSVARPVPAAPSAGTDRTSARSSARSSSKPGTSPASGSAGALLPTSQAGAGPLGTAPDTAGSQLDADLPEVEAGAVSGTVPVSQQPVVAAPPTDPGGPAAVITRPATTRPATGAPDVSNPAAPPVANPPIVTEPVVPSPVDAPGSVVPSPATAMTPAATVMTSPTTLVTPPTTVMTPPAPVAADPAPSSIPDTATSAAPPVPGPAPQPTGSDTVTPESIPDASEPDAVPDASGPDAVAGASGNGASEVSTPDDSTVGSTTADSTPTT